MSTNPPTAVMIPSVISSGFKLVLDPLELFGMGAQVHWRGIGRLDEQRMNFARVIRIGLSQSPGRRPDFLTQPLAHARGVDLGEVALARLLVDQRPLRPGRSRL